MSELHDKARALLALRDKATPGPWIYVRRDEWGHSVATQHGEIPDGSPNYWTVASINKNREPEHEANARLIASAHDMADTIRDLLAENERLSSGSICELAASNPSVAEYCRHWESRAEAAEAELKAQVQCTLRALNQRQKAEAQFRALCEAEPVAWRWAASGYFLVSIDGVQNPDEWYPVIPRPSMEGNTNG